jgi:hypothetical protein
MIFLLNAFLFQIFNTILFSNQTHFNPPSKGRCEKLATIATSGTSPILRETPIMATIRTYVVQFATGMNENKADIRNADPSQEQLTVKTNTFYWQLIHVVSSSLHRTSGQWASGNETTLPYTTT